MFEQSKYANEYTRQNYDRVSLVIPKGKKAELKDYADARGESINALIIRCIETYTEIDLSRKD